MENDTGGENSLADSFKILAMMKYGNGMMLSIKCTDGFISGLSF